MLAYLALLVPIAQDTALRTGSVNAPLLSQTSVFGSSLYFIPDNLQSLHVQMALG